MQSFAALPFIYILGRIFVLAIGNVQNLGSFDLSSFLGYLNCCEKGLKSASLGLKLIELHLLLWSRAQFVNESPWISGMQNKTKLNLLCSEACKLANEVKHFYVLRMQQKGKLFLGLIFISNQFELLQMFLHYILAIEVFCSPRMTLNRPILAQNS